jgi:integrase
MTVKECIEIYAFNAAANGKRSRAWRSFAKQFIERWGALCIREAMKPASVRQWVCDERNAGSSDSTIKSKLVFLRSLCGIASDEGFDVTFPRGITVKVDNARVRFLTEAEERRLKEELAPADWDFVLFFLRSGLRSQEGFNLQVDDCSLESNTMRIRRTKTGKAFTARMHPDVRKLVVKAMRRGARYVLNSPSLASERCSLHYSARWKEVVFRPALKRAGIKDFRLHDLRHTAATRMANKGVEIQTIAAILNHSSLASTRRYCHIHARSIDKALAML